MAALALAITDDRKNDSSEIHAAHATTCTVAVRFFLLRRFGHHRPVAIIRPAMGAAFSSVLRVLDVAIDPAGIFVRILD